MCGFCDMCGCEFCNVWVCVGVGFIGVGEDMCGGLLCVCVCMCEFCYVWVCVCVGFVICVGVSFVMCGCVYVWVL